MNMFAAKRDGQRHQVFIFLVERSAYEFGKYSLLTAVSCKLVALVLSCVRSLYLQFSCLSEQLCYLFPLFSYCGPPLHNKCTIKDYKLETFLWLLTFYEH